MFVENFLTTVKSTLSSKRSNRSAFFILILMFALQACVSKDQAAGLAEDVSNGNNTANNGNESNPTQALLISTLSSVNFGQVGTGDTVSQTLTIMNAGVKTAEVDGLTISFPAAFSATSNLCSNTTLATGSSCTLTLEYSPSATGFQSGSFSLSYHDDGSSRLLVVPMSGTGGINPELTFSESPYNFGNVPVGNTQSHVFTVSNNTTVPATIGSASLSGAGYSIAGQNCNSIVLNPAASCSITVAFTPSSVSSFPGTLSLPFTNSSGAPFTKATVLGGSGVAATTSFPFSGFSGNEATDTVAASKTSTGVILKWTAQPLATYYKISYTGGPSPIITSAISPSTTGQYPISGLSPNTTYIFKINAFDSNDVSDGNNSTLSITTPNVSGSTFMGWTDAVATGSVFTDIGVFDNSIGSTGSNRLDHHLAAVAAFENSSVNTATDQIDVSVDFATGMQVKFRTDGTPPAPLAHGVTYYAIRINSTTIKLATTYANAVAGTEIDLTSTGTGNMTLMPGPVAKIGWDLFTIAPSGMASSYNIYRSTTPGSGFTLLGTSNTQGFIDYQVNDSTKYYYKVHPIVSGTQVTASAASDSEIEIFVPAQNMSLLHRWIANREACTNLMESTFTRSDNYSCAYAWGVGYGANTSHSKLKWDLGYSMAVDRWQNGCKMSSRGTAAPSGGSDGDIYFKQSTGSFQNFSCMIKHASHGWIDSNDARLTPSQRATMFTNYPGYAVAGILQDQAYSNCQERTAAHLVDGNNQSKLRLFKLHELNMARAAQGVNINKRSLVSLDAIFNGINIPVNGSCNTMKNNQSYGSYLDGVTLPHPAFYTGYTDMGKEIFTMTGAALTRNCQSRYEIANLWDMNIEWTSTQFYAASAGTGRFIESSLNPKDNLLEDFVTDGVMGFSNRWQTRWDSELFGDSARPIIPMFGVVTLSVDANLGSRMMTQTKYDFGLNDWGAAQYISMSGNVNGVHSGQSGPNFVKSNRLSFGLASTNLNYSDWGGRNPATQRCAGEVVP